MSCCKSVILKTMTMMELQNFGGPPHYIVTEHLSVPGNLNFSKFRGAWSHIISMRQAVENTTSIKKICCNSQYTLAIQSYFQKCISDTG